MKHFEFPSTFRKLYEKAVGLYAKGQRGAETYFAPSERAFLTANGITAQHLYDYAEDHNGYNGEPGLEPQAKRAQLFDRLHAAFVINASECLAPIERLAMAIEGAMIVRLELALRVQFVGKHPRCQRHARENAHTPFLGLAEKQIRRTLPKHIEDDLHRLHTWIFNC